MDTQNNAFTVDDDFTFPHTRRGQALSGVLESAAEKPKVNADAVEVFARQQARTQAMTAVLAWMEDGEYNYNALDEYIIGMADLDGDFEIGDDEEAAYNAIWAEVPDALLSLGADEADTNAFVNGDGKEADDAAARVAKVVKETLDDLEADDDELIAGFALGEDAVFENASDDPEGRHMVLEATYRKKKVVRDGKVVKINKRVSGKVRLSAAQKAGLRKARRKANTASARLHRKKSMRIRARRGM